MVAWPVRRSPALGYNSIMRDKRTPARRGSAGVTREQTRSAKSGSRCAGERPWQLRVDRLTTARANPFCQDCEPAALAIAAEAVVTIGYVCPPFGPLELSTVKSSDSLKFLN
jgi:hypothetical protein